jgi:large subunit ribosomal protein L9
LKDVYKLGRAGDVKKVADGYGRNYLLPQGLAVLATPGALKQAEQIRERATTQRAVLNKEMGVLAERIEGLTLAFPAKASETGKLYGSITAQMIAEAIQAKAGVEVLRRQVDTQPLRALGEYTVRVRLTVDLIPTINVIVHREGEAVEAVVAAVPEAAPEAPPTEAAVDKVESEVAEAVE